MFVYSFYFPVDNRNTIRRKIRSCDNDEHVEPNCESRLVVVSRKYSLNEWCVVMLQLALCGLGRYSYFSVRKYTKPNRFFFAVMSIIISLSSLSFVQSNAADDGQVRLSFFARHWLSLSVFLNTKTTLRYRIVCQSLIVNHRRTPPPPPPTTDRNRATARRQ